MAELTERDVIAASATKSDQLNAIDLYDDPVTVTITGARKGNAEQMVILDIEGPRPLQPWKPCKGMIRILKATYSPNPHAWVGHKVTLYCDPEVYYGGKKVGGIRISHLSGIDGPRTYPVVVSRNKTVDVTIQPLAPEKAPLTLTPADLKFIEEANRELREADSLDVLKGYGEILKGKSKAIQDALRPLYAERKKELSNAD